MAVILQTIAVIVLAALAERLTQYAIQRRALIRGENVPYTLPLGLHVAGWFVEERPMTFESDNFTIERKTYYDYRAKRKVSVARIKSHW